MTQTSQEYLQNYQNLLDKRTNLLTRSYHPVVPIKKNRRPTPVEVKMRVLQSQRLNRYIDEVSDSKDDRQKKVFEVLQMLSEIAYDRKLLVVRSLGQIIGTLLDQLYTSVNVNEKNLEKLKSSLGHKQVIYMPSHRSYADFMLMSFICFCYNLEIPAIAAGMDFHGMMGLGEMLRKTGAFFMRRTFGGNDFYWRVFKEYMHEIITFSDIGLEFFVEGTRSRSCKALTPKIGLLSMALEPYFMGEVHDLMVVPVSVTYEKPLEEQLFVYELLGIPKPKESTMGLIKAVTSLKSQNLGKIFFDFNEPMSLNEYFGGKADRFKHASEPAFVQNLNGNDVSLITTLANEVVRRQQHKIVIMSYNLIALIYNEQTFTGNISKLTFWELKKRVLELIDFFEAFGAIVAIDKANLDKDIRETISIHHNILEVKGSNSNIQMIKSNVDLGNVNAAKLKGARLSNEVMNIAVPTFSLQLYCNPTLYWLAQPSFLVLSALGGDEVDPTSLRKNFELLRQVFVYEFVLYPGFASGDFDRTFAQLLTLDVFKRTSNGALQLNLQSNFVNLLLSALAPFLNCYLNTARVILKHLQIKGFIEKDVFVAAQSHLESEILKGNVKDHPYALCLDSINMAVLSLCNAGCLFKEKQLS